MIDHQEELRTALEKNRVQKEQIKQLETTQTSRRDVPPSEMSAQLEELQTHVRVYIMKTVITNMYCYPGACHVSLFRDFITLYSLQTHFRW